MATTTQNIIRDKYAELISYISLISDDVRIEDRWSKLSLTIDVYISKRQLISFRLQETSEYCSILDIDLEALDYNIGHWCFPYDFNQRYMFDRLISKIISWHNKVINSNIDKILMQAQDKVNNKVITSEGK